MKHYHPLIRWTTLKDRLKDIFAEDLNLEIQQKYMHKRTVHRDKKFWGNSDFNVQFVTVLLNRQNIWWFPKDSKVECYPNPYSSTIIKTAEGIWDWNFSNVKGIIIKYLDLPKERLLTEDYSWDFCGITEILRAADRRIGYKRLLEVIDSYIPAAQQVFNERFKMKNEILNKSQ